VATRLGISVNYFQALYDLGLRLLTAEQGSELGRLTTHSGHSGEDASTIIRSAILQRTMPGEDPSTRWGILRVSMRNLVNRAYPPMPALNMLGLLNTISSDAELQDDLSRTRALATAVAGNARLSQSLQALLQHDRVPGANGDYVKWLSERIAEYRDTLVENIDPDSILCQLRHIASDHATRIPNVGIALAANLFADLGIRAVGKPDLHVRPTVAGLLGIRTINPEACIREVIRISQHDAILIKASGQFGWLDGGLFPRDVDRMIYLIGSDNFRLDGTRRRTCAPMRRQLMLEELRGAACQ
jgi:hypothetical protein